MLDATFDQQETGFVFTDEDYTRRYARDESATASPPAGSAVSVAKRAPRIHGGGNSFMRARRRRIAASSST